MVPENVRDFFVASGGAAGALIGLLFVAISVVGERLARAEDSAQLHRVRAAAALTAFVNALSVSLFALIPGHKIGPASVAVGIGGLWFVLAALLSLVRRRQMRWDSMRDGLFLAGLVVVFVVQVASGAAVIARPGDSGSVDTIAILVVVCFLIGIARSWELIGGPTVGFTREVAELFRSRRDAGEPADPHVGERDAAGPAGGD